MGSYYTIFIHDEGYQIGYDEGHELGYDEDDEDYEIGNKKDTQRVRLLDLVIQLQQFLVLLHLSSLQV
ncbi:hypothetical protein CVD19_03075 [Bacillus sp. T33-2]|nr:hypothetical protein CVD19_03075 [Bacillus sp. T33-2]